MVGASNRIARAVRGGEGNCILGTKRLARVSGFPYSTQCVAGASRPRKSRAQREAGQADIHTKGRIGRSEMFWKWEQGRLEYFQFDALRKVAKFGVANDLRQATSSELETAVELPFRPDNETYRPWRNYGRLFQIAMIAIPHGSKKAKLTSLGKLLAEDGKVTTDEYLHFLAQATTQPSPAHKGWNHTEPLRYPLLFALRFILARAAQKKACDQHLEYHQQLPPEWFWRRRRTRRLSPHSRRRRGCASGYKGRSPAKRKHQGFGSTLLPHRHEKQSHRFAHSLRRRQPL